MSVYTCSCPPAVDSFPDGRLSVAALECLQYAAGVQLFLSIGTQFALLEYSPIRQSPEECGRQLIERWLEGKSDEPATWMSLVEILMMSKEIYSLANTILIFFATREDTSDRILQKCHRQTEGIESKSVYIHVCAQYIIMRAVRWVLSLSIYMITRCACVRTYVRCRMSGGAARCPC